MQGKTLVTDFFSLDFCSSSDLLLLLERALGGAGFVGAKNLRMSYRSGTQKESTTVISWAAYIYDSYVNTVHRIKLTERHLGYANISKATILQQLYAALIDATH